MAIPVLRAAAIHSTRERAFHRDSSQSAKPHIRCALTYLTLRSNKVTIFQDDMPVYSFLVFK
ncbi:hypothetical protein RHMOL_RhmolMtG0001700 (mitochondrion) [Rhododendron molle]|nr:hypothetical protein RHMOL_RhmolMtG0001700 [Rhododendron molle]